MISVVASSFGGYLAMLYALEKPDKINKLVLEGSPAMVESSRIPFFMKMMLTPGIKWMAPKLQITKFIFRKIMKEMGHGYSFRSEESRGGKGGGCTCRTLGWPDH